MIEKEMLDQALEEYEKSKKRAENSWKHNFLVRYMEHTEESLKKQEYDNFFFVKPKNLRTREETKKEPISPKKSPLKVKIQPAPKSILKKPTLVSSETTMTSAIIS